MGPTLGARRALRRFLEDEMGVRAANAERAHTGTTGRAIPCPRMQRVRDEERTADEVDRRIWRFVMDGGGDRPLCEQEPCFDQPRHARRAGQMTEVRLRRADAAVAAFV